MEQFYKEHLKKVFYF